MRLYSFVIGLYFSPIQHGIQTGHCAVELIRKYERFHKDTPLHQMANEWADFHKTFIILNGYNLSNLQTTLSIFANSGLPFSPFYEDTESVGGILTCVSAVVPSNIYLATKVELDNVTGYRVCNYHWKLVDETIVTCDGDPALFMFIDTIKSGKTV